MDVTITSSELFEHLSDVLDRIENRGELFIIERNGEAIASFGPPRTPRGISVRELVARVGDLKMPGDGFADDLEAIQASQGLVELPEWPD